MVHCAMKITLFFLSLNPRDQIKFRAERQQGEKIYTEKYFSRVTWFVFHAKRSSTSEQIYCGVGNNVHTYKMKPQSHIFAKLQ